jgi:hypothetical protein
MCGFSKGPLPLKQELREIGRAKRETRYEQIFAGSIDGVQINAKRCA